jgi:phage terminase large subunit-like protein
MPPRKKVFDFNAALLEISEQIVANTRAPNIKKYKPHQSQFKFHSSPKKKKLYIGGNRSGKTTAGVTEAIWRATATHPYRPELNQLGPTRGRVAAVDFPKGVEAILIPQYKQWLYPSALVDGSWERSYDKHSRTLTFANGSFIEFMSYDQDLDKFAGTSRHWIHFDEEPPKPIYGECRARLVDTNGEFWITMTPVEGMTWIYDDLYEPNVNNPEGTVEIIEVNTLDNPYLTAEGIANLMEDMDEDEITTRVGGGFVRQGGRVYKNFDPTPGAVQVLPDSIRDPKTYFPSSNWLWIMALDHGLNNPTAVLWLAVNDDGFVVCFDEWYRSEYTIPQHAEVIKRKIKEHGRYPDLLVADPALAQRTGATGTNMQQEYQKYGLSFILGNNDVKAGVIRVKKYFQPDDYPGSINTRHPLYGGLLVPPGSSDSISVRAPEGKYPRLLIDPRCEKLIWELKRYRWKTYADKKKQYENNPYDEPHKKDDHACDALRYAIMTRPDLYANSNEPNPDAVAAAFKELDERLVKVANNEIDDPRGLLNQPDEPGAWHPGHPVPRNSDWHIDEHMGGLY